MTTTTDTIQNDVIENSHQWPQSHQSTGQKHNNNENNINSNKTRNTISTPENTNIGKKEIRTK